MLVQHLRRWSNIAAWCVSFAEDARHLPNGGLMTDHLLRRWPDIKPPLVECLEFHPCIYFLNNHSRESSSTPIHTEAALFLAYIDPVHI